MNDKKKNFLTFVIVVSTCFLVILPKTGKSNPSASDDIRIKNRPGPINITNPNGGYIIDTVSGDAELKANGSIRIGRIEGNLRAITPIGDINIGEVKGNLTAITKAGNVNINKAHKHVFVESGLGEVVINSAKSVHVNNLFGGDVKVLDVSGYSKVMTRGNIFLVLNKGNSQAELCDLASTAGDITLHIAKNLGADIEIRIPLSEDPNRETRIESDFAFLKFKQRCQEKRILILTTSINNGGGKIKLFIERGNIYIRSLRTKSRH
jgi:hypothetical protein